MFGLDEWLAGLGGSGAMAYMVAILLGLRHATDPDHLTAVSTLFLGDDHSGARRATTLGFAWGLGHASTLFAFGLPAVLFRRALPDSAQRIAEFMIGVVIVVLASRLLLRCYRGYFHLHVHTHGSASHAHPHAHEHVHSSEQPTAHTHRHAESLGRSPLAAFGVGLIHGMGGSAAVGVLLVSATSNSLEGAIALLLFAAATAASMTLVSGLLGYALARGALRHQLARLVPVFGAASFLFGVWYSVGALHGAI
jgi:ABC-type nickel/cobalt efflux system permease component RcnA